MPPASTRCASADRLGAQALRVGRVLDVAAGMDAAVLVEQRGADRELEYGAWARPRAARAVRQAIERGSSSVIGAASTAAATGCTIGFIAPSRTACPAPSAHSARPMKPASSTTVSTYGSAWIACTGTSPMPGSATPCRRIATASRKPNSRHASKRADRMPLAEDHRGQRHVAAARRSCCGMKLGFCASTR